MNELEKLKIKKTNENGDTSYTSTGDNLVDLYFMADYFENNLEEVKIGDSTREQIFAMYMRDPRYGQGRKWYGRKLQELTYCSPVDIVTAGRYDDLWRNPTDKNLKYLWFNILKGDSLAKKWAPRLTGANAAEAKALCKYFGITEKEYRKAIKEESTVEYKLSYTDSEGAHSLVDTINFEQVPSLAMTKYMRTFLGRDDLKDRYISYLDALKEGKAKINTATTTVYDAKALVTKHTAEDAQDAADIIGKKIVKSNTEGVSIDALCVLDTSGSMTWSWSGMNLLDKATSLAHAISMSSTYLPGYVVSFSACPELMEIKGDSLKEQYRSMYTGDCSNTNLVKVMNQLENLEQYPEFLVILSDMEFDEGSMHSKERLMNHFKDNNISTKIVWWNLNNRNRTSPEVDEYGNFYLSGTDLSALVVLSGMEAMKEYLNKLLREYTKKISGNYKFWDSCEN